MNYPEIVLAFNLKIIIGIKANAKDYLSLNSVLAEKAADESRKYKNGY